MNWDVAGDAKLSDNGRTFIKASGVDRLRSFFDAILQIASGSYEYSDVGTRYEKIVGMPYNEGRIKQVISEALLLDSEISDVKDLEIVKQSGRAYQLKCRIFRNGQIEDLSL